MKATRALALLTLLLPAAHGAWTDGAWREQALQQAQRIIATWQHEARGVQHEFTEHGVNEAETTADSSAEETGEDTVITCDTAMLFDTESHNIVYVGHVRLSDPRLKLHAAGRLFIRLPENELSDKQEEARQSLEEALPDGHQKDSNPAPAATVETEDSASAFSLPEGMETICMAAADAVVDAENNHILLFSPAGGMPISVESGANKLTITPAADAAAHILADEDGNITLVGQDITAVWVDEKQQRTELRVQGGSLCYNAAEHAVALTGQCTLHSPQGDVRCAEQLLVRLQGEHAAKENPDFLQQFAGLSVKGIAAVHAEGGVEAATFAGEQTPASSLRGEVLDYDAETGLCSLSGSDCKLTYGGQYSLKGAQRIVLSPDGALTLEGNALSGTYQRPSENGETALTGNFRTGGLITITPKGDHAEVCLPQGITAADPEADFTCTGELTATLLPAEGVNIPHAGDSKLNLALARFRTLDRAAANGGVIAHRYTADTHQETASLQAERAEFDLSHRAAELFGTAESPILAFFNGNKLEATPDADTPPHLFLSAEGDAELRGGMIAAAFTDEKQGTITARCAHALRLIRAENKLETEGAAEFRAAEGILTTKGPLRALLTTAETAETGKGFRLPYTGIREASTELGGTVQTTKGSLQCSGPIRVTMDSTAADNKMGGLQTASAEGNVAIAGKDSTGRLIRATGDRLTLDAATGEKVLSGSRVTLSDGNNTHTAAGGNAAVRIDARNNATIRGAAHTTTVNRIREQMEQQQQKKKK